MDYRLRFLGVTAKSYFWLFTYLGVIYAYILSDQNFLIIQTTDCQIISHYKLNQWRHIWTLSNADSWVSYYSYLISHTLSNEMPSNPCVWKLLWFTDAWWGVDLESLFRRWDTATSQCVTINIAFYTLAELYLLIMSEIYGLDTHWGLFGVGTL